MTIIQTICLLLFLACFLYLVKRTDFTQILRNRRWQHIVFGSIVMVSGLWWFRVSIYDGLVMHFLWLTTLTLVLGFRWACIAGALVLLISTIIGHETWVMFGVNGLLGVMLPIVITYAIFSFSFHHMPRHLFVYLFVCAFFPGAITIAVKMFSLSGYYYLEGLYTWDTIQYNYTNMTLLMAFPEAFFNGFSITCLVMYKPDLVYTYHDNFYIKDK